MHDRFKRKAWVFKSDFTGALAKWLVKQSPYVVPDNLEICIKKFHIEISKEYKWHERIEMVEVDLSIMTDIMYRILERIPEIKQLNEPKNEHDAEFLFVSALSDKINPDDDFIDIMAVAQNITCEFADREDLEGTKWD